MDIFETMKVEKELNRNTLRKINNPVMDKLGRIFTRIIEIEADLEVTRYDLADMVQFNFYKIFNLINSNLKFEIKFKFN